MTFLLLAFIFLCLCLLTAKKGIAGFCRKHKGYVLPFSDVFPLIRQQETLVLEEDLPCPFPRLRYKEQAAGAEKDEHNLLLSRIPATWNCCTVVAQGLDGPAPVLPELGNPIMSWHIQH